MTNIREFLKNNILLLDGAMGTQIQGADLDTEKDYWGQENCSEILNLSRPDFIRSYILDLYDEGYLGDVAPIRDYLFANSSTIAWRETAREGEAPDPIHRFEPDTVLIDPYASALTGESVPVEKGPGDDVLAGSVVQLGSLTLAAKRVAKQTVAGRVIELTASALQDKGEAERLADTERELDGLFVEHRQRSRRGRVGDPHALHARLRRQAPDRLAVLRSGLRVNAHVQPSPPAAGLQFAAVAWRFPWGSM